MWPGEITSTFRTIGIVDVLDIGVVAYLVYVLLRWLKRAKAAFVARGIILFALLYVIARQTGMYLTTWMFQGFFAIFLIALVVIFQEELRSFFERLAVWSLRRRAAHPLQPEQVEHLVRVVGELARQHIGALIVLKGRDPLERHVQAGQELDGKLSPALLASLFDPHSEGHDGALILDGDRVTHFGAYLPLSKEFYRLAGMGTRHTAALGLSERADALCIAVSEERGTISLAQDGDLTTVGNLLTLEERIASFLRERAQVPRRGRLGQMFRQNLKEKLLAAVVAPALWLVFVQGYTPSSQVFEVRVESPAVPDSLQIEAIRPAVVTVALSGLRRDLHMLKPLNLRVVPELTKPQPGLHRFVVTEEHLRVPEGVRVLRIEPPVIEIQVGAREPRKPFLEQLGLTGSKKPESHDASVGPP